MEQLNYKDIWETLSQVDVSKHTETKGEGNFKLTYLSWAWAWGVLMEHYPESQYSFEEYEVNGIKLPYCPFPDGSGEVVCKVYIGGISREMPLAVMDYKSGAIKNPNARNVNDSKMRCLVKCLALFGLGHYIYAGEDIPFTPSKNDTEKKAEEKKPVTKKTTAKKTKLVDIVELPTGDEKHMDKIDDIKNQIKPDEEWTDEKADLTVELFTGVIPTFDTVKGLFDFWQVNSGILDKCNEDYPEHFNTIKEAFTKKKEELQEKYKEEGIEPFTSEENKIGEDDDGSK